MGKLNTPVYTIIGSNHRHDKATATTTVTATVHQILGWWISGPNYQYTNIRDNK